MGLLSEGAPLSWDETKALAEHVREHGVNQFINLYNRVKDRQNDVLMWGDEVEYIIVKFDDANKVARVSLKANQLLQKLHEKKSADPKNIQSEWHPEYGAFMIEGTPGKPFGGSMAYFNLLEANMRYRREEANSLVDEDECVVSITNFPRLGAAECTYPIYQPSPNDPCSSTKSLYFPEEAIFPDHPRYKTVTRNVRLRRGEKMEIKLKVFKDENTDIPVEGAPKDEPDVVLLDAMGFGACCCCLQITFQASNLTEARTLYDQLNPICPVMLALSAASPIYRGYLTESDSRWNVLSSAVDCRTEEERGLKPLQNNKFRIAKSRYDSIDSYISPEAEKYNDIAVTYDNIIYKHLRDNGIDHLLAQHVAHLFIRDTVAIFNEKIDQNDEEETDHFENIQTTNWQTMRLKPPPLYSKSMGWRVEFRPCEVQISDFENAAIVCFILLLTRTILAYQLNFLMPISKVDENMQTAQKRDACRKHKFWFRKTVQKTALNANRNDIVDDDNDTELELMSIAEIFNGKPESFPGLVPLVRNYVQSMDVNADTSFTIQQYLHFIEKRAAGELLTTAMWMREQVLNHPHYKKDSIVSDRINYDVLKKIQKIQEGKLVESLLLPKGMYSKTKDVISTSIQKHSLQLSEHIRPKKAGYGAK